MSDEYEVKRGICETYTLRWKNTHMWAVFMVTDNGFLSIQSDFGNYSYRWQAFGDSFKQFLTTLDDSYLMSKLAGTEREFYLDQTLKILVEQVLSERKQDLITEEKARELMNEIESLQECGPYQEEYYRMIQELPGLMEFYGNDMSSVPCSMGYTGQMQGFVERIWPAFRAVLNKELIPEEVEVTNPT